MTFGQRCYFQCKKKTRAPFEYFPCSRQRTGANLCNLRIRQNKEYPESRRCQETTFKVTRNELTARLFGRLQVPGLPGPDLRGFAERTISVFHKYLRPTALLYGLIKHGNLPYSSALSSQRTRCLIRQPRTRLENDAILFFAGYGYYLVCLSSPHALPIHLAEHQVLCALSMWVSSQKGETRGKGSGGGK
jgi:hypothetical protein